MKRALLVGGLLIVVIAFSAAWGSMVAGAASQHDWAGVAFGLFILVCALGASAFIIYCRIVTKAARIQPKPERAKYAKGEAYVISALLVPLSASSIVRPNTPSNLSRSAALPASVASLR